MKFVSSVNRRLKQIPIEGVGRSHPYLKLSQGVETSRRDVVELARSGGSETPLALASADLNEDGIPDLVTAWSTGTGGMIKIHPGNPAGFGGGLAETEVEQTDSFFPGMLAANMPEAPMCVETGDFTGDGHQDVICTRRGSTHLWLLVGDGRGNVLSAREVNLPGSITAFQVGQINRHDGLNDVMLGVTNAAGACFLVFDSAAGGLETQPETISVPSPVTEIAFGNVIGSVWADIVGVAGKNLIVIEGRDVSAAIHPARVEIRAFPQALTSVAVGNFTGGQALDVAVLDTAGSLHIFTGDMASHSTRASIQESTGSLGNWRDETRFLGSQVARLTSVKISSLPYADLLATDTTRRMRLLTGSAAHTFEPVELTLFNEVVDVLPLKINGDGLEDLVVFQTGEVPLMRLVTLPMATFMVNSTGNGADSNTADGVCNDGSGNCTLRAAIQQANASSGSDVINFAIAGAGPHTIAPTGSTNFPSIQDTLTINGYSQSGTSRNTLAVGDNAVLRIELNGSGAGPASRGLQLDASNCVISGLVINRFQAYGIELSTGSSNQIEGCFIGTNVAGDTDLGNLLDGIRVSDSTNNTIGGSAVGNRNIISGNNSHGIDIDFDTTTPPTGNTIVGNYIGVNAAGTGDLGNSFHGIDTSSSTTTIGGSAVAQRNVISGNNRGGVRIDAGGISGMLVAGNYIGTDANGAVVSGLGNSDYGVVVIAANTNTIGGTSAGQGNVIAGNGFIGGVHLVGPGAANNRILGNSIFSNTGVGIDIAASFTTVDGVTPNDLNDDDFGVNGQQNFPVLTGATASGGNTIVTGMLNSTANTAFRIEFFSNPTCDSSGNGEGQTFLGFTNITTVGNNATFSATLSGAVTTGHVVTAIATDAAGNSSEFSACQVVCGPITAMVSGIGTACADSPGTFAVTVTVSGGVAPYTATLTNGGGTQMGSNPLTFMVSPSATTTYSLQSGTDANGCGLTEGGSATITVNPVATVDAGLPQTVCANQPAVTLAGVIGGSGTAGTWSGGGGTFTPDNRTLNATYTPTPAEVSSGSVTLTLTADDPPGPCGPASDTVTIIYDVCGLERSILMVADTFNNRIQRFDGDTWSVIGPGTVGSGNGQFRTPEAVTFDASGQRIYVADTGNNRIQWSTDGGTSWANFATVGSGLDQVRAPQGLAYDPQGNLYVADTGNGRVLRFDAGLPGFGVVIATNGAGSGQVGSPRGLAIDLSFRLFVADDSNSRILRINNANTVTSSTTGVIIASRGVGLNQVQNPQGVAIDTTGTLYIADTGNSRVLRFLNANPANATALALTGSLLGQVNRAEGVTVTLFATGPFAGMPFLVIGDTGNHRIQGRFVPTGGWALVGLPNGTGTTVGRFRSPSKIR
ncbi:MAG: hypothetical protein HY774_12740 [Acidobacteria bacterium]|nr:hypothetical protein [Acidobacteriota bacterium]